MLLRASGILSVVAALLVASPPAALANINDGHSTASYARTGGCGSDGTNTMPVEVVFEGFARPWNAANSAEDQMDAQIDLHGAPWLHAAVDTKLLNIEGPGGVVHCEEQIPGRVTPYDSDDAYRTLLRLWAFQPGTNGGPLAGAPVAQHRVNGISGCGWAANLGTPGGFTRGRQNFEQAFQGANPFNGPYPLDEVDWGNSAEFQVCDHPTATVGSDGNVAIVRPKDSFGYNDDWRAFSATPNAPAAQNPRELAEAQGASVARYAINWATVGLAGSDPVTPATCLQMGGNWGNLTAGYDRAYTYVTGRQPCDDTPPMPGIRPVLAVLSAPAPYARWCNQDVDADCGAGHCTATSDQTPATTQMPKLATHPTVASGTAADADWKGFVQNVALRYPLARGIEIWNEPNLTEDYWGSCLPGPGRYAQLVRKAKEGVVASGTVTNVVLAGMSPQEGATDNRNWMNYLNAAFDADPGVTTLFNALGLHPYRSSGDPTDFGAAVAQDVGDARSEVLIPNGIPLKTIWVTEVGVRIGGGFATSVGTQAEQAAAMGAIYYRLRNMVPVVIAHRLADAPPGSVEGAAYGAVTRQAQEPFPLGSRRQFYFEICERRGVTPQDPEHLCYQP